MQIKPFDIHDKEDIAQQEELYRLMLKDTYSGEILEKVVHMRMSCWRRNVISFNLERRSTFSGKVRGNFLFGQKLID